MKEIGNYTFRGCKNLTFASIGNGVININYGAFKDCSSLTSVTIGSGITSIYGEAFAYCPYLADVYCYAVNVPSTVNNAFASSDIEYATLHVPEYAIERYKATYPWKYFGSIVSINNDLPDPPAPEKCATPTIRYFKGKLVYDCETEGAICQSTITDTDITSYSGNEVQLTATYNISVYATKTGYVNSDTIQATLCWIDVIPQTEGIVNEDAVTEVKALPVLIQSHGGTITVQGANEGTEISIYSVNGMKLGSAIATHGLATISTSLQPGSTAIVKIGEKAIKVLIK